MNSFRGRAQSRLEKLAAELGLRSSYVDVKGETRHASMDDLMAVLRAMHVQVASPREIDDQLRLRRLEQWRRPLPFVSVAWEGEQAVVEARLPALDAGWKFSLELESGEVIPAGRVSGSRTKTIEGRQFVRRRVEFGRRVPVGYHTVSGESGSTRIDGSLFVAPMRAYSLEGARWWGVFAPLYALRTGRDWGVGDLTDLAGLDRRVRSFGGDFVGTLPIMATFLDDPFEPSPYAPVSRLFWNELYLDVASIPELELSEEARSLIASAEIDRWKQRLRAPDLVDYRDAMALKRRVLSLLAGVFFERASGQRRAAYANYLATNPELPAYARFRAGKEGREGARDSINYHLYVQWVMHEQLEAFASEARKSGPGLYLDFPLGVHPDGYDIASRPALFATGASAGAPPDALFAKGQSWGLPPMLPEAMRAERFAYFIQCIRQQLRYAGMLRIDHIMGLHRTFWVPNGAEPLNGVYVRYPDEELFAILAIESHRHRSVIIGEDLGTVPVEVNHLMEARGVKRMFVLQYELSPASPVPGEPPAETIASLNTHDMPTFQAFWQARDVDDRLAMGLLQDSEGDAERLGREEIRQRLTEFFTSRGLPEDPLEAALLFLAGSDAEIVLVNLEDLWRELAPQNVPGTTAFELPNWQRKLKYDIAAAFDLPEVRERLRSVNARRKR